MLIALILSTIPEGMTVFWEYTGDTRQRQPAPPAGWVIDSSFNGKFPRGCPGDSVGITGGTSTHTHTKISGFLSGASGESELVVIGPYPAASATHTHNLWASGTISTASHLPPYRDFLVIKKIEEDTGLPAGVVMMFASVPPPGWTVILADLFFPRGSLVPGREGGSLTHYHTFSGLTGGVVGTYGVLEGSGFAWGAHTHNVIGYTAPASNLPPYIRVGVREAGHLDRGCSGRRHSHV